MRAALFCLLSWLCLCLMPAHVAVVYGSVASVDPSTASWRIRIHSAAVAAGDMVTLRDIADVHGTPPAGVWEQLADRPLWAAPPEPGKPLQINKTRLARALRESLGDLADLCLLPPSLALQRGGAVLREEDLRGLVVKELTPVLRNLNGEAELDDFRLPPYAFVAHAGQRIVLEPPQLQAGRLTLRFLVQEVDGSPVRRFSGSVMLNLWMEVPCAAVPLNRGDSASPEQVTWIRKNLAHLRGDLWDGRGGPWQVQRAIGTDQPIYLADLAPLTVVRKGSVVTLIYNRGSVQLAVQAEALEDGAPGTTVQVRNLQSRKTIFATVRDADTVEVK